MEGVRGRQRSDGAVEEIDWEVQGLREIADQLRARSSFQVLRLRDPRRGDPDLSRESGGRHLSNGARHLQARGNEGIAHRVKPFVLASGELEREVVLVVALFEAECTKR